MATSNAGRVRGRSPSRVRPRTLDSQVFDPEAAYPEIPSESGLDDTATGTRDAAVLEGLARPEVGGRRDQPQYSEVDYEKKYAPDPFGKELNPDARVWSVYNDETQVADAKMTRGLQVTIDTLLVFAGLFSAVVTTFVAQSSQKLDPDYAKITASLLNELVLLQRATRAGVTSEIPISQLSFDSETYRSTDLWVNGLWLTSLTLSLLTALLSVLAKQWIESFSDPIVAYSRDRAIIRQYRVQGFERWRVPLIIGFLPLLLSVALILFLAGLAIYIMPMNSTLSILVIGLSGIVILIYTISIILPVFIPHCAYKTPVYKYVMALLDIFYDIRKHGIRHRHTDGSALQPEMHFRLRENRDAMRQFTPLMEKALVWLCKFPTNKSAVAVASQAALSNLTQILERDHEEMQEYSMRWAELRLLPFLVGDLVENTLWKDNLKPVVRAIMQTSVPGYRPWDVEKNAEGPIRNCPEHAVIRIAVLMRERARLGAKEFASAPRWAQFHQALNYLSCYLHTIRLHSLAWRDLELALLYCSSLKEIRPGPLLEQAAAFADHDLSLKMAGHPLAVEPIRLAAYATARGWEDTRNLQRLIDNLERALAKGVQSAAPSDSEDSSQGEPSPMPPAMDSSHPSDWSDGGSRRSRSRPSPYGSRQVVLVHGSYTRIPFLERF
ncbi:hypothetical protein EV121DRAFT_290222 [Schizophyllum commune]